MQPEIHLGPLTLQSFGLMLGLSFVVAGVFTAKRLKEIGRPPDWAYEMVFAALVGGIVGARLWSVVENWDEAKDDVFGSLFSGAGLVFYGGLLGGALAVIAWAWWRGVLDLKTLDVAAVPLAAAYAIGRIGCQLAGDGDYGKAWTGRGRWPTRTGRCRRRRRSIRRRCTRRSRWASSRGSCGAGATACAPAACSRSTSCCRGRSASSSSSCAATTASPPGSRC